MSAKRSGGYKRLDPALRLKALELLRSGETGRAVARTLGVSYPTIINWKRAGLTDERGGAEPGQPHEMRLLKLENDYLRKRMETDDETARLHLEVDYLKKRLAVYEGD